MAVADLNELVKARLQDDEGSGLYAALSIFGQRGPLAASTPLGQIDSEKPGLLFTVVLPAALKSIGGRSIG